MSEYQSRISALPDTESTCACSEKRSPIHMLNLASGKCYGCRWCEVRLIDDCIDGGYLAVLRHHSDPAYNWLPENMRESGAKAGFGYSMASNTPWRLSRRYTVHNSHTWLVDGCMAIDSGMPPEQVDEWRAKVDKDTDHKRAQIGLAKILNPTLKHKLAICSDYDHRYKRFGNIAIDAKYLDFVMSVHPQSQALVVSGKRNQHPILFMNNGLTIAAVMPVWVDFERN